MHDTIFDRREMFAFACAGVLRHFDYAMELIAYQAPSFPDGQLCAPNAFIRYAYYYGGLYRAL